MQEKDIKEVAECALRLALACQNIAEALKVILARVEEIEEKMKKLEQFLELEIQIKN